MVSSQKSCWGADNPSTCALAQALHPETCGQKLRQVTLLSTGTGTNPKFLPEQDAGWGLAQREGTPKNNDPSRCGSST